MQTAPQESAAADRTTLIRDVAVLQLKLLVDGFRDLVLLPASLIAGLISLLQSNDGKPGGQFYELLAWGKRSEAWINLFGAIRNAPADIRPPADSNAADIDDIVSKVETFVVDEYRKGGVTAQAKSRLDQALKAMQKKRSDEAP